MKFTTITIFFLVLSFLGFLFFSLTETPVFAQQPDSSSLVDRQPDTWVATDALGRTTPTSKETRPPRTDRFVGIFYFLTHGSDDYYKPGASALDYATYGSNPLVLRDNTQLIKQSGGDPITKPSAWPGGEYWWGQPAVGYFLADDSWVARKDLTMLSDAGVDTLIFDVTNVPEYWKAIDTVLGTAEAMRAQGINTPQFCFITYNNTAGVAQALYDNIYSKGRYKNLWFYWDGKPLIFGSKNGNTQLGGEPKEASTSAEVANFFTWRHSWANTKGPNSNGKDEWEWSDSGDPQLYGWHDNPNVPEEMPVMAGAWASSNVGRSYQGGDTPWGIKGSEPPLDQFDMAKDVDKGLFFAQEWRNALKTDPQFVWVTGWNEWTAGRQSGAGANMIGHITKPGEYYFVDEYNEEFSRDIMPMKDGFGDDYYMQLVDAVREYKGARPIPSVNKFTAISLSKGFDEWSSVQPVYYGTVGGAEHRNHYGWASVKYVDNSGRNEIVECKAACDKNNIYFYARTSNPITKWTDDKWMQLLIDRDLNPNTGWNGYDYLVNAKAVGPDTTTVKRFSDGKTWNVKYLVNGTQLEIVVPRSILGQTDLHRTEFDFHWCDNVSVGGSANVADWWYTGDSAPDGRFNYRYENVSSGRK